MGVTQPENEIIVLSKCYKNGSQMDSLQYISLQKRWYRLWLKSGALMYCADNPININPFYPEMEREKLMFLQHVLRLYYYQKATLFHTQFANGLIFL